jgi:general secretion pathway protein K
MAATMGGGERSRRGFALVIVLWSMALLALLAAQLTSSARVQLRLAANTRDTATAEAAADGAIREAMFALAGDAATGSPGQRRRIRIGDAVVDVVLDDEAAKINPNATSLQVLRGLLAAVGVDQARAARLAGEIVDWRNRSTDSILGGPKVDQYRMRGLPYRSADRPFDSVDEISLIPDMTRDIIARLSPWLSVWHEGDVSARTDTSPVESVMADASVSRAGAPGPGYHSANLIMRVTATAVVHGQTRFVRSAVVRIRELGTSDGALFQILTWN